MRRTDHLSKESYRLCKKRLQNWRRGQGPTKGCRAIDEWMNEWMNVVWAVFDIHGILGVGSDAVSRWRIAIVLTDASLFLS
jgi:hypothetical protein